MFRYLTVDERFYSFSVVKGKKKMMMMLICKNLQDLGEKHLFHVCNYVMITYWYWLICENIAAATTAAVYQQIPVQLSESSSKDCRLSITFTLI